MAFLKLVLTIAACLSAGALFGAYVADANGFNPYLFAVLGGAVGIAFGLVATGEMYGGKIIDALFPPGDGERASRDGRGPDRAARGWPRGRGAPTAP
jgi:hypothetical protein